MERGGWVMGIEEGTFWDEHWVLYGNQFDNKLHIKKKKREREGGRQTIRDTLLKTENKLRLMGVGRRGKYVMGIEEGICWDEH